MTSYGDTTLDDADPRRPGDPPWRDRTASRHLPAELADSLYEARLARGWSLRRAARETGVSVGMLCHLQAGKRLPSAALAEDLIENLALSPEVASALRAVARPYAGRSSPYRSGVYPLDRTYPMGRPDGRDLAEGSW